MPHSLSLSLVFFLFCLLDVTGIKDSAFVPQTTAEAQSRRRTSSPRNEISFFIYRFQSLFCGIKSPLDGEERKIRKFLQSEAVECCKTYPNEESLRHEYVNLVLQTMIHHASLSFRIQFLIFHKLPPFPLLAQSTQESVSNIFGSRRGGARRFSIRSYCLPFFEEKVFGFFKQASQGRFLLCNSSSRLNFWVKVVFTGPTAGF